MTITDINQATLAQLSAEAHFLWQQLEEIEDEAELDQLFHHLIALQDATEQKVDAVCYVADQLKLDLEAWESRLNALVELYKPYIERRKRQLSKLKDYLLHLHNLGLLPDKVMGKERRINFQRNSMPSVNLLVAPEELPPEYRQIRYVPLNKEIAEAHKSGTTVSDFAEVKTAKHVRFYIQSSRKPKS